MGRALLLLLMTSLPLLAAAESEKLPVLQARLSNYYNKLLTEAQAEDAEVRANNLPEKYADHEKVLAEGQAVFEDYMNKQCANSVGDECRAKLIATRLEMLGYEK